MVYYSNPYKRIIRAFIRAIKVFFSSLVSKSFLIIIICFLIFLLFINNNSVQASSVTYDSSVTDDIIFYETSRQNELILTLYYPFIENTNAWVNTLKPMLDNIKNADCDIYVTMNKTSSVVQFNLFTYYGNNSTSEINGQWVTSLNNIGFNIAYKKYTRAGYHIDYYPNNNTFNLSIIEPGSIDIPKCCVFLRSDMWSHFMQLVYGGSSGGGSNINYSIVLEDIKNYLDSIDSYNTLNNNTLNSITQILNTIANKSENDYTQQITDITNQINSLNTSINNQTQQQHQDAQATQNAINNQTTKIEEQTNSINDMSDFMQDDTFTGDSITNNMPTSDEFQDVTENGFDNIFTTLRNTFTSDNYQDVEFVVPFSNGQKITIPSNLTENIIPAAIKTLIQMVYWYFIARFIVKDIASYIEKAKSGDIFSSSDSNIKTDML